MEIEVGFGKGLFLLNSAQARPAVNFVGIEIARKYQLFTATRIAKRRLQKFNGVPARTFYLHLKECEYRFNNRTQNLTRELLKLLVRYPL